MTDPVAPPQNLRQQVCDAWRARLALLILLCSTLPTMAQPLIRLNAGQGALIFGPQNPHGELILLGAPVVPNRPLLGLSLRPAEQPPTICCQAGQVHRGVRCETDRGVPLHAREIDIYNRYGPPDRRSGTQLGYSGVRFALEGSPPRVSEICVIPR